MICKCKECNFRIKFPKKNFDDYEEELWGHIQTEHEDIYEDIQDLETPYMLEECYE